MFTLTDYCQDLYADKKIVEIICKEYKNVYFWPQGIGDMDYYLQLNLSENIRIINPSLQAFNDFLVSNKCDYIGTRLHAGIKAMQCNRRSVIFGVDNRAQDMKRTYGLNLMDRSNVNDLPELINSEFETNICIKQDRINEFLAQFV